MFHYLHQLKVISRNKNHLIAEILEDLFGLVKVWVRTRFRFEEPERVTIEQIRGPFTKAIGWFQLQKKDETTTSLVHGAELTAGGPMGFLGLFFLRSGEAKRRMMQEVLAIKERAEADTEGGAPQKS